MNSPETVQFIDSNIVNSVLSRLSTSPHKIPHVKWVIARMPRKPAVKRFKTPSRRRRESSFDQIFVEFPGIVLRFARQLAWLQLVMMRRLPDEASPLDCRFLKTWFRASDEPISEMTKCRFSRKMYLLCFVCSAGCRLGREVAVTVYKDAAVVKAY